MRSEEFRESSLQGEQVRACSDIETDDGSGGMDHRQKACIGFLPPEGDAIDLLEFEEVTLEKVAPGRLGPGPRDLFRVWIQAEPDDLAWLNLAVAPRNAPPQLVYFATFEDSYTNLH